MIKLILLILGGFVFYSLVSGLLRPKGTHKPQNKSKAGEKMVADPQCGTYLPQSEAISATIHGQQHYFCSKKCLNEFKQDN